VVNPGFGKGGPRWGGVWKSGSGSWRTGFVGEAPKDQRSEVFSKIEP
jgi:hypothetical protein